MVTQHLSTFCTVDDEIGQCIWAVDLEECNAGNPPVEHLAIEAQDGEAPCSDQIVWALIATAG